MFDRATPDPGWLSVALGIARRLLPRRAPGAHVPAPDPGPAVLAGPGTAPRAEALAAGAAISRAAPPATAPIPQPEHCDWAWRPEAWQLPLAAPELEAVSSGTRFGAELELFHDATNTVLSLRQIRSGRRVPFLLALQTAGFGGSFLSLALTLPPSAVQGLQRRHILRLTLQAEAEGLATAYVRLNLRHGPNVSRLLRPLPLARSDGRWRADPSDGPCARPPTGSNAALSGNAAAGLSSDPSRGPSADPLPGAPADAPSDPVCEVGMIDFDLQDSTVNESRLDLAWLDLILERPVTGCLRLHDLTLTRRPRAEV